MSVGQGGGCVYVCQGYWFESEMVWIFVCVCVCWRQVDVWHDTIDVSVVCQTGDTHPLTLTHTHTLSLSLSFIQTNSLSVSLPVTN